MQSREDYVFSFPEPAWSYNRRTNKMNRKANLDSWPPARVKSLVSITESENSEEKHVCLVYIFAELFACYYGGRRAGNFRKQIQGNSKGKSIIPLSLDIEMHILFSVLHTFIMELVTRICLNIKTSYP